MEGAEKMPNYLQDILDTIKTILDSIKEFVDQLIAIVKGEFEDE